MDTFNDFFARSSLKILGSQFYPPKQLTNVLTGLPPLHLIVRTMIVKFIHNNNNNNKSLTQQDSSSARILKIEETPNHEFFPQVYDTKMFLLWKLKYLNEKTGKPFPTSVRELKFAEIDESDESDCLGFHSDNEREIVTGTDIVTISLGESRVVKFKALSSSTDFPEQSLEVSHGDLFLMSRASQDIFQHSVVSDDSKQPRISITLRLLKQPSDDHSSKTTNLAPTSPSQSVICPISYCSTSPTIYFCN